MEFRDLHKALVAMCRLFGYLNHNDLAVPASSELEAATARLADGGPDEQRCMRGPGWAFGATRLAMNDISGGAQPFSAAGGKVLVAAVGEIYNAAELRRTLTQAGYGPLPRCDCAVIPGLYLEYGERFVDHLDGMFAVAVLDLRAGPRVVLATDRIGMKPIFYGAMRGRLVYASEIGALRRLPGGAAAPRPDMLETYLATKTPLGEETMFEDVSVLSPSSTAVFDRGQLRLVHRSVRAGRGAAEPISSDLSVAGVELRTALQREASRLMEADTDLGFITSGGLDSGLVTVLGAAVSEAPCHSFNIAYRGTWPSDERGHGRDVARAAGTQHHQVELDPAVIPDLLPIVVDRLGQPNADPITVSTYALFEAIKGLKLRGVLSGDGADELFGGYDRLRAAVAASSDADWVPAYVDALAAIPRWLRNELYSPDYKHYVLCEGSVTDALADQLHSAASNGGSRLDAMACLEIGQRLPAYHLRRVDHLSMAHGIEVRLPFCQPRIVEFAASTPSRFKIRGDQVKRVLYQAAIGCVPTTILNRPKQPFTLPIAAMMRPGTLIFDFARDVLLGTTLRQTGLLDSTAIGRLLAEQALRPSQQASLSLWSLIVFALWLDQSRAIPTENGGAP